jgi:hypothetical protein
MSLGLPVLQSTQEALESQQKAAKTVKGSCIEAKNEICQASNR